MRLKAVVPLVLVTAATVALCGSQAEAATLRVVVVKTQDAGAYVKELDRGRELFKKVGSPVILRVWRAQYAGENAGSVVVAAEYPDLAALAKDNDTMASNPELRAWLAGLDKVRTIVSDSIYQELK